MYLLDTDTASYLLTDRQPRVKRRFNNARHFARIDAPLVLENWLAG